MVSDVRLHPGSAVGEIAERTGLPQSAVSAAVTRLRQAEAVVTEPDTRDRRRLLIRPAPETSDRVEQVRASSIDLALAKALDTTDAQQIATVTALLEELAQHLTPQAITRLRS
ncbi:MarR family winged helix-turn-helix transcriptional regulator [Nonomuraea turcica]|uniref:MarR family winged helix-turn-helix transcriptional regulator n=1 Tax=Nonomuraea sp. G32 TaxID=3067274 RepID=UPI00273B87FD|nr:MarR family transcriptional regulator [Nonomuraea sp. G32]MDP4500938.1 MarR family transcriptional regulator [Nonomuraea sp. G32]